MGEVRHSVIFLRGLGDNRPMTRGQAFLTKLWHCLHGIELVFVRINWADQETLKSKLARITAAIDKLHSAGQTVSLIGISAGASAAFNAYGLRSTKINKLVFVCGKFRNPHRVGRRYYRKNPALRESLELSDQNYTKLTVADKAKILSIRPVFDELVPLQEMKVPGARSTTILATGHVPSIFLALTIYSWLPAGFIKSVE